MLYIISGASRSGKTIIAKKISVQKGIPYFSLDWLTMGFTNGLPEHGIHDLLFPDEIAQKSWSFLKAMFESMLYNEVDYIIEGESILPELIIELSNKYPNKIKICFVGFIDIDPAEKVKEIKNFSFEKNDWLRDKSDAYILDHIQNMIAHSIEIKKGCDEYGIKYFDVSKDFPGSVQNVIAYLLT